MPRVLVVGLDCVPPHLAFERFADAMPNLSALRERGTWGPLRSTVPPITVPAWTCMVSGRDPGELGLYGFRNRVPRSYELALPTSGDVRVKRIWDLLGEAGREVAALFVPLTFPPTPVRGVMASCFLTPSVDDRWTFPAGLATELEARFGPYRMDVKDYRTDDPSHVLEELYAMGKQHFAIARHVWESRSPDFMMMVEMGPDRFHHALYRHLDPAHPDHDPDHPLVEEGRRYYAFLDEELGELVALAGDETAILVVSDHGARPLSGAIAINELLRREGWLALKSEPGEPVPLTPDLVDWSRTRAWGEGGYYARLFLNVEGREPEGVVPAADFEETRDALAALVSTVAGPDGGALSTEIVRPQVRFREARGAPPDLMAFFGDLAYRSSGRVGLGSIHTSGADLGPDGCNHDWDGIFVLSGGGAPPRGAVEGLEIYDVTATVLGLSAVEASAELLGVDRSR
jgi:predicted AlkP superfamily phosphohydrolase/phosphomutase